MKYEIRRDGNPLVNTDWPPLAQAAWHKATRDQAAGGVVELLKDGRLISSHRVVGGRGARWPDGRECGLQDVVKALVQLLRDSDWDTKQIAAAMTEYGLPTSRARVDALRGSAGRSVEMSHAEVVVLVRAVLNAYKHDESTNDV